MVQTRLEQISSTHLGRYLKYNDRDREADKTIGRREAGEGIPGESEERSPFEVEALETAKSALHSYDMARFTLKQERKDEVARLAHERDHNLSKQHSRISDTKEKELQQLDEKIGPASQKMVHLSKRKSEAEDEHRKLRAELNRPLIVHITKIYMVIIAVIALAEVPINRMAFELFFQEHPAISTLIAAAIGGAIAMMAHFIGLWLRQSHQHERISKRLTYYGGIVALLLVCIPLLYLIAALREHVINLAEQSTMGIGDIVRQSFEGGVAQTAESLMTVDLSTAGWTLFVINIVILSIGVLSSFVRHDPHPYYERVVKTEDRLRKQYEKRMQKYDRERIKLEKEYDKKLAGLQRQIDSVKEQINKAEADLTVIWKHRGDMVTKVAMTVGNRIVAYNQGNRAARKNQGVPGCLRDPHSETIKTYLKEALQHDEDHDETGNGRVYHANFGGAA